MKKQKRTSQEKGITIVALIITIILLLILAVVAIRTVQGDGIIGYAKSAKDETNIAKTKEEIILKILETRTANNGIITEEQFNNIISQYNGKIVTKDGNRILVIEEQEIGLLEEIVNFKSIARISQPPATLVLDREIDGVALEKNSAIYIKSDNVERCAIRTMAEYTCPEIDGKPDTTKVLFEDGTIKNIQSRHILLGAGELTENDLNLEKYTMKTSASGDELCNNYLSKERDGIGYNVKYATQMTGMKKKTKDRAISTRSVIILEDGSTFYSSIVTFTTQGAYNEQIKIPGYENLGWFSE